MTIAIISALITVVIIIGAIIVFFALRKRNSASPSSSVDEFSQLSNVVLGASEVRGATDDPKSDIRVNDSKSTTLRPSDRLTRRFAVLGGFAAAVLAVLGGKAWAMQVMSNEKYASQALDNLHSSVKTPAPRGVIYDRKGRVLVNNKVQQAVVAEADVANDDDVVRRLSAVLGIPTGVLRVRLADETSGAQSQRVVCADANLRDVAFISEHPDAFEGVSIVTRTIRDYPYGALASHLLGYVGSPTEDELKDYKAGRDIESTDYVGKSGVELSYDSVLSGDHGVRNMVVDAQGDIVSVTSEIEPTKGYDLHLTIDAHAQYVAEQMLAQTIAPTGDIGTGLGTAGAVVGMNVKDGSIVVMASYPTFDLSYFTNGIPEDVWDLYNTEESNAPMLNRAINGQYAAASTFKAFTSMAGLEYGFADYDRTWNCTGKWDGFNSGNVQKCWKTAGHGSLNLHDGIVVSCDVVFYEIAKAFFDNGPEGNGNLSATALQDYLRKFHFGSSTGIDLANESTGRIPTPEWKKEQWKNVPSEALWRGGDYSNMIIGQGDVLITPIQQVVAYGGIATGKLVKPHLLKEVRNNEGEVVKTADVEVVSELDVNQEHLDYVRNCLHDMISGNKIPKALFGEAGIDVAGKSGTAEQKTRGNDGWFVAYGPYEDPEYVVASIVEQGGGGTDVSSPIVCAVLEALIGAGAQSDEVGYVNGSSGRSVSLIVGEGGERQD